MDSSGSEALPREDIRLVQTRGTSGPTRRAPFENRSSPLASLALNLLILSPPLLLLAWGGHLHSLGSQPPSAGEAFPVSDSPPAGSEARLEAEYESLLSTVDALEDADISRQTPALLLEAVSKTVGREPGVWLASLVLADQKLELRGSALRMALLGRISRQLEENPAITEVKISSCRREFDPDRWSFEMRCSVAARGSHALDGESGRK